jgi:glycerol-3-phosphate dehydrogenase
MTVRPELRLPLGSHPAATAAEVVHVIKEEMAVHLADIIVRRLGLGAAGHPGKEVLEACASVAARELGWSDEQRADEIAAVEEIYRVP